MIEPHLGLTTLDPFLADLLSGAYALDCGAHHLSRIRDLVREHADLPLGSARWWSHMRRVAVDAY